MNKWDPVCVEWLDAHTDYEEMASAEYEVGYVKKAVRRSIGWLIARDKDRIVIAMEDDRAMNEKNDTQTVTTIPSGMVREVVQLRIVRPPRKKK